MRLEITRYDLHEITGQSTKSHGMICMNSLWCDDDACVGRSGVRLRALGGARDCRCPTADDPAIFARWAAPGAASRALMRGLDLHDAYDELTWLRCWRAPIQIMHSSASGSSPCRAARCGGRGGRQCNGAHWRRGARRRFLRHRRGGRAAAQLAAAAAVREAPVLRIGWRLFRMNIRAVCAVSVVHLLSRSEM